MWKEKVGREQRESCQQQDQEKDHAKSAEHPHRYCQRGEEGLRLYKMSSFRAREKGRMMEKAGSLLGPVVKRLGIESGVRLSHIKNDWHTLFDKPLSLHMSPSRLTEGELLLNVDSPVWVQQLNFYKREITARLSRYGVREIRFRIGKVSPLKSGQEGGQTLSELSGEDARFIEQLVDTITDDDLKSALRSAAEKSLRTKKKKERH